MSLLQIFMEYSYFSLKGSYTGYQFFLWVLIKVKSNMTSGGLIILLVISLQWYCRATTPLKNLRPSKPIFFLKTLLLQLLFMCLSQWWSIICQNVSTSVTSYITSLFRKRFDQAWLSDFLRNLLHLIIVPQLQWNLICLKWVEILEHNIWRKWLKQRLFNIHSGELQRKTNSFWKLDKFCALSLQL